LVPVLRTPEDIVVGETLAMAETLAEENPEVAMWPRAPELRARARWVCAEMTSAFGALRSECPMQLAHVWKGFRASDAVLADLGRVEILWQDAFRLCGASDGWLFGAYSLADAFYAPVAARIIGYDLPVSEQVRAYCLRTINDPAFTTWRDAGLATRYDPFPYPMDLERAPWPESGPH
jgi:glutathione S-transferase